MKYFVTGGNGYIGRHLIEMLLDRGDQVHVLCRGPLKFRANMRGQLIPHQGDLLDRASLSEAIRTCTHVFHLAGYAKNWARDPGTYREINVGGTQNVLCAGAEVGVKRVVITSSVLTMGFSNGHPLHENEATTAPLPTEYAESKREAEHVALLMCHEGPEVVIVNPTRVYGPGRMTEGNSVTRMIKLHLAGRFPLILGDGSATGNYAYVRDVARGHLLAMSKGRPGQRYILGGENVSFKQLFEIVRGVSGAHRLLAGVPESLALALGRFEEFRARHIGGYPMITPGWVRTFLMEGAYSSNKAEAELGYVITPLTAGIRETITWLNGDDEAPHPEDVDYRSFPQSLAVASGV